MLPSPPAWCSKKGKKVKEPESVKELVVSAQSQCLDLSSPAGKYSLDLAHPASACIIREVLALQVGTRARACSAGWASKP